MVAVLDAMGYDVVIVETVGVGQDEVDVVSQAETTVVVTVPGLGDEIQAIKAGILEIADVLVVNKADREGADRTVRDLTRMLELRGRTTPSRSRSSAPSPPPARASTSWPRRASAIASAACARPRAKSEGSTAR